MSEHKACPSHCCPIHGCKYGHEDCPIVNGKAGPTYGKNNGCECCEMDAADPKNIEIASLRRDLVAAETENVALLALVERCRPAVLAAIANAQRLGWWTTNTTYQTLLTEIDAALKEGAK